MRKLTDGQRYVLMLLEARKRFGLRKRLGNGAAREGWLTRDGRVLKLPVRGYVRKPWSQETDYTAQTAGEIRLMTAGKTPAGFPVARGEVVTLVGVKCILMEYVTPFWDVMLPRREGLPQPHRQAYYDVPTILRSFGVRADTPYDGQYGLTADGRVVCYDAGVEVDSTPEEERDIAA